MNVYMVYKTSTGYYDCYMNIMVFKSRKDAENLVKRLIDIQDDPFYYFDIEEFELIEEIVENPLV